MVIASAICLQEDRDMRSAEELKQVFQEGWNIPLRVDNYVRNVADAEFTGGECYDAWREALRAAIGVSGSLQILDVEGGFPVPAVSQQHAGGASRTDGSNRARRHSLLFDRRDSCRPASQVAAALGAARSAFHSGRGETMAKGRVTECAR